MSEEPSIYTISMEEYFDVKTVIVTINIEFFSLLCLYAMPLSLFQSIAPIWGRVYVVKPLLIPHTRRIRGEEGKCDIPLIHALCRC